MVIIDTISFCFGRNMTTKDNATNDANVALFTTDSSNNVRENPPKFVMIQRAIATVTGIRIETFWRVCRISSETGRLSGIEEVESDITELAAGKIEDVILRRKD
jgi:hypothetical protein